jgi:DNA-directed RNA polymerase sigma subunit (sigma70/sigma32)
VDDRRDDWYMAQFLWPGDQGWPSPVTDIDLDDGEIDMADPADELDVDALALHAPPPHLWDDLTPVERQVVAARYGLGCPERSMKELHVALGITRHEVRDALESGLAKLRRRLTS